MIDLDLLFERVIGRLMLTSDGKTTNHEGDLGGPDSERDLSPHSSLVRDIKDYRWRYRDSRTDEERRAVIEEALEDVRRCKCAKPGMLNPNTLEWRVAIAHHPQGPTIVSKLYGVSRQTVYDFRKKYGEAA